MGVALVVRAKRPSFVALISLVVSMDGIALGDFGVSLRNSAVPGAFAMFAPPISSSGSVSRAERNRAKAAAAAAKAAKDAKAAAAAKAAKDAKAAAAAKAAKDAKAAAAAKAAKDAKAAAAAKAAKDARAAAAAKAATSRSAAGNTQSGSGTQTGSAAQLSFEPLPLSAERIAAADRAIAQFASATQASLAERYNAGRHELRLFARPYDRDLLLSFERAVISADTQRVAVVERAVRATLGDFPGRTPAELASRISTEGAADPANFEMRDACLHFAMLYKLTGDRSHAQRSAELLAKFATAIPQWPILNPYYAPMAERRRDLRSNVDTFKSEYSAGIWGGWVYYDLVLATPLVQARAFIMDSGALREIGAEESVCRMFEIHLETQRRFSAEPDYSNMDSFPIRGKLDFGRYLPDAQLVHDGVAHLAAMFKVGFYPDGWWHEGSPAYHEDLVSGLRWIASDLMRGYSDPPGFVARDGTRFDNLDLEAKFRSPLARADAVTLSAVLPDQTVMGIHDTPWPTIASRNCSVPNESFLYGAMGQGTLVSGQGSNQSLATLHWSRAGSHAHFDALSLFLWAKGTEAISGTQYRPIAGSNSSREWHQSTGAFATVVVDETNQAPVGPRGTHRRQAGPDDQIQGVPDFRWRWSQVVSCNDAGNLKLFSTEFPDVQVIEADATKAYDAVSNVSLYQRTIALVKIDDSDSYIVDIFRVRGGRVHDYMLHSALQLAQQLRVSTPTAPSAGTLHRWIGGLRSGTTDSNVVSEFGLENGVKLVSFVAGVPGTTVITGQAPAMRRMGDAPFLGLRRIGGNSTFVAVHHVVSGGASSRVEGIELVPTNVPDAVALRVHLGSRTDVVVSSLNPKQEVRLPDGTSVRGAFAHFTQGTAGRSWAMLVDGDLLATPDVTIDGPVFHEGIVSGTMSTDRGSPNCGFNVAASIPSLPSLSGAPIIVDQGGVLSWAYRVKAIEGSGSGALVSTPDEPGFIIDGDLIKQTAFPNWGIRGAARFRIPGYAVMTRDAGQPWSLVQTGFATGSVSSGAAGVR